jgi:ParB family chromosome partitioning protein
LAEVYPPITIAQLVGKSRSHVVNIQRLLDLPEGVLDHLAAGRLDMGHARALIGHPDAVALAERAVAGGLSVREVEKLVRRGKAGPGRRQARTARDAVQDADIAAVQNHLEEFLGLSVRIATDADPRSGAVTIRYRTLDQLDLICQRLTGASI